MSLRPFGHHKEEIAMTSFAKSVGLALAFATTAVAIGFSGSAAYARGGKEVFIQDYQFAKPMHGYSGHSGNYYCDYQRLPNRKCFLNANGTETCKIVGWTLREMCQ
jgi:hypothetical protein